MRDIMDEATTNTWLSDTMDSRDPRKSIGVPEVENLAHEYVEQGHRASQGGLIQLARLIALMPV
jgi:hypothetical protein